MHWTPNDCNKELYCNVLNDNNNSIYINFSHFKVKKTKTIIFSVLFAIFLIISIILSGVAAYLKDTLSWEMNKLIPIICFSLLSNLLWIIFLILTIKSSKDKKQYNEKILDFSIEKINWKNNLRSKIYQNDFFEDKEHWYSFLERKILNNIEFTNEEIFSANFYNNNSNPSNNNFTNGWNS